MNICKNCTLHKQWVEDMDRYEENPDSEEFGGYEPSNPCYYCSLNNNPYT